jgi:large-conductance mechanosensitive channel
MAGQSRTLKLALLAEVADFTKNIGTAGKDTKTLGDQFEAFGKKAALAFAAAGAAIGAYAKVAIENAAADEKAQRNLALTIENTTTATANQIAGVEKYISTTSIAIGVTDDELRPAFARLVRSTKDVEDAQKLLNLALDVSAATGKPLEAVANALGKAYDGNLNALGRLGLGIDQSILKSKDFDQVFNTLTDTFGGFAENEADSTEKAFQRIKIASDEVQEQIGAALLPVVQELTAYILTDVVPVVQSFVDGLTGANGLDQSLTESQKTAIEWGKKVRGLITTIIDFKDQLLIVAGIIGTIFVANKIAAGVQATIALIKLMTAAYAALRNTALAAAIAARFAANPLLGLASAAAIAAAIYGATKIFDNADAAGNAPSTGSIPFSSGFAPAFGSSELPGYIEVKDGNLVNILSGQIVGKAKGLSSAVQSANVVTNAFNAGSFKTAESATSGTIINLTVNGALDSEGTARTIVETLNNSYYRGTGGATALQLA